MFQQEASDGNDPFNDYHPKDKKSMRKHVVTITATTTRAKYHDREQS